VRAPWSRDPEGDAGRDPGRDREREAWHDPGLDPPRTHVRGLWVAAAGLALVALHQVLAAVGVGSIGAPTDIGGGLIAVAGVLLVAGGLLAAFVSR
jgi:hypothetical protein